MRALRLAAVVLVAAWAPSPAQAVASPAAGQVSGVWDGPLPQLGQVCPPTTDATITMTSEAVSLGNLAATGYAWTSACQSALLGGGRITLDVDAEGAEGEQYECTSLSGQFTRVVNVISAALTGRCVVDNYGTGDFIVEFEVALLPATSHGWFIGTYSVHPAAS